MADGESDDGYGVGMIIAVVAVGLVVLVGAVVVGGAVVASFVLGVDEEPPDPTVDFDVERVDGGVEVSHAGGEAVDAHDLLVRVDGEDRDTWAELADGVAEVVTGDSIVVSDVEDGQTVAVVWTGGEENKVLTEFEL